MRKKVIINESVFLGAPKGLRHKFEIPSWEEKLTKMNREVSV